MTSTTILTFASDRECLLLEPFLAFFVHRIFDMIQGIRISVLLGLEGSAAINHVEVEPMVKALFQDLHTQIDSVSRVKGRAN